MRKGWKVKFLLLSLLLVMAVTLAFLGTGSEGNENSAYDEPVGEMSSSELRIEGFGRNTRGGAGGTLYTVTTLSDSGPCSLRDYLSRKGPRIIKFGISGTIELKSNLEITEPFVTIDGSDAPFGGVAIRGAALGIYTDNVIVRYIRFRSGEVTDLSVDSIQIGSNNGSRASNVVLDHISASWGDDGNIDITGNAQNVTVQWSILSEDFGPGAMLIGYGTPTVSVHHNLFAHNSARNPEVISGNVDFVNNVVYNYGGPSYAAAWEGTTHVNFVANFYKAGVDSLPGEKNKFEIYLRDRQYGQGSTNFIQGNIGAKRPTDDLDEWSLVRAEDLMKASRIDTRHDYPLITTHSALAAYDLVMAQAGARLPCLDSVDRRVLADVKNGTGSIIKSTTRLGGWPDLTKPCGSQN